MKVKEDSKLNYKGLIISFIITIGIAYGMFSDDYYTGLISWIIIGTILMLSTLVLVIWFIHDNKNIIINYIKNMFRK